MKHNKNYSVKNEQSKKRKSEQIIEHDDQVEGRNAVIELLESGKDINKIYITKGE